MPFNYKFQFRTQDYLAYLQMSNRLHTLVENSETKKSVEETLRNSYEVMDLDTDVDDVEYLLYFDGSYRNDEKIGMIFSDAVECPFANKLVTLIDERIGFNRPMLLPINDPLSSTHRLDKSLRTVTSRDIKAAHIEQIRDYLIEHTQLIDVLPFISRIVKEAFPPEVQISLELYKDPEIEDSYLTFLGRSERYDEDFLEMVAAVRTQYAHALSGKSGWILVTTDFETPNQGE